MKEIRHFHVSYKQTETRSHIINTLKRKLGEIENEQHRDTGNIGCKTQKEEK